MNPTSRTRTNPQTRNSQQQRSFPPLPPPFLFLFFLPNSQMFLFFSFCNVLWLFFDPGVGKQRPMGSSRCGLEQRMKDGSGSEEERVHLYKRGKEKGKKRQRGLCWAHRAGRRNAQCMEARIQIENRWDFSRQPDIRGRGRRGETSPSGPAAKRYGREGPKNPCSVQNPSSLRPLGLPARQRAAQRGRVVFNALRGLILPFCV